jgi:hypothetical protein
MALYDNPPQVDPATGRLPTYKQVLQQDPTTGVYKIKYEYTPIVSSSTAGQTLQTQLTTPVTTFPGISDSAGSGSDDDDTGGDTGEDTGGDTGGDTGTGGNQDGGQGGGDRGYYNFQGGGAQQGDGLNVFGSGETKTDFQKDLDSAYPGLLTRVIGGIATSLVAGQLPGFLKLGPSSFVSNYRKNAANKVNTALEDGTAFTGLSLSQIEAIAESKRYPTEVTTAATNYIKNYNENQASDAQTTSAFNTQVTQSYLDTLPDTPSQAVNPDLLADSAISTELRGSTKTTTDLDTFGYNQANNPTTSMTETTNYTNEDGTVETAPSGLQYASNVAQNKDGGYSKEQQKAAQDAVDGAVNTGGSEYGMDDGVSAVGYGATTNDDGTTSYSGTVSWSGGTVTTGKKKDNDGKDGPCFLAGTLITMADETKKPIEEVELMDKVAAGGYVGGVGKFLTDELYDYNGVKVSGSHLVNENNKWMHVKDSKNGKPLGNDTHVVYVLGTEHRKLLIENILFTDYLETKEQKMFIAKGSDYFFNNHGNIGNQIAEENLKTLNAKN